LYCKVINNNNDNNNNIIGTIFVSSSVSSDTVDTDFSPELLSLMKEKLPGYVLKCFLATGFNSEEAIAYMDTNSVKTMEAFIEK